MDLAIFESSEIYARKRIKLFGASLKSLKKFKLGRKKRGSENYKHQECIRFCSIEHKTKDHFFVSSSAVVLNLGSIEPRVRRVGFKGSAARDSEQ